MRASIFSKMEYEIVIYIFLILKMLYQLNSIKITLPIVLMIIFLVFMSWILGKVIRNVDDNFKRIVLIFVAFFLGSSVSNSVIYLNSLDERASIYKNTFFIICLLIAFISINKHENKWDIPVLCFICIAIEPIFIINYMPIIAILLFYQLYSSKHSKEDYWFCASSLISAIVAFLLFFKDRLTFISNSSFANVIEQNWKNIVLSLAVIFPIILLFTTIWVITIKNTIHKVFRWIIVFIMLEPIISAFALAFNENYLNVIMISAFGQFCFVAYFIYIRNKTFLDTINKTVKFIENNLLTIVLALVYLTAFSYTGIRPYITRWIGG